MTTSERDATGLGRRSSWLRERAPLVDGAIAGVLFLASAVLLFTYRGYAGLDDRVDYAEADLLGLVLVALSTLPLWWRRSRPVQVTAVAAAASLALGSLDYAAPLAWVALLAATYACGAYAGFRYGLFGVSLVVASSTAHLLLLAERYPDLPGTDTTSVLVNLVSFIAAWALGRGMRNRRLYTQELEDRTRHLERTRAAEVRAALAEERGRIARELHDVVAHHVSVMTVQAAAARRTLGRDAVRSAEAMAAVEQTGRSALAEMRRLVGVLRGPDGDRGDSRDGRSPQPGIGDLPCLLEQLRDAGLPVEMRIEGQPRDLAPGVDLTAYRVVQEALTNTLKHSGRTRAWVLLRYHADWVVVCVSDEGRGPDGASPDAPLGHGLLGMRERVALYGGTLSTGPLDSGGFRVVARLPFDHATV